ncbi:MAG: hypothetical protein ACO1QS_20275 [Verrucomicrobiota bacterium]
MSLDQLEAALKQLPVIERRRFVDWVDDHRAELLDLDEVNEAQKEELLRRRQEYEDHPEKFLQLNESELDGFFEGVRREVQARVSSARSR